MSLVLFQAFVKFHSTFKLFNLYINDFFNCLSFGEAVMFADDTTLVFKSKDNFYLEAMSNEDMLSAANWLEENKLSLNIKKTKFMHFDLSKKGRKAVKLNIGSTPIEQVKNQKFLGVIFDEKLSWKAHINSIISKLNSCLGASRRARSFLNKSSLLSTTWGSWEPRGNKVILQRLQAISNKFFRLIYNLDWRDSVRSLLKSNNVLNIFQTYDFNVGKIMYKAIENDLPQPLQKCFSQCSENPLLFCEKNCRIKRTEKGIFSAGPKIWNILPIASRDESNSLKFKKLLKTHILEQN